MASIGNDGLNAAQWLGVAVIASGVRHPVGTSAVSVSPTWKTTAHPSLADAIHPVDQAQLLSYVRRSGIGVGLLINCYVTHLRNGIERMVDGKNWEK
jgi:hypothetical protein